MKTLTFLIILLLLFPCSIEAQSISDWRPENRTGVSEETGLMKSWPAGEPTLLWSNTDLSKGYSQPSFGANTIYITGNIGNDDILYALSMNGKILWQTVMGRAWTGSTPESRATPTVEGNGVLYLRHTNALMAYNIKTK